MRPRVFPAEDVDGAAAAGRRPIASMRPRVFPAEDCRGVLLVVVQSLIASMRPRVFPAEDTAARRSSAARFVPRKTAGVGQRQTAGGLLQ